jgi:hypothetical protein
VKIYTIGLSKNKHKILILILGIYIISYCVISVRFGEYRPAAYGLHGIDGKTVIAPKKSLGYSWSIFEGSSDTIDKRSRIDVFFGKFYMPLIILDEKAWHRNVKEIPCKKPYHRTFPYK